MEQIRLDIVPKGIMPVCHASQYDKGRVIRCNLMDGLQGYVLTDETITLNVRKPDDNIVTAAVEVVSGTSYVDFVTTEQMTACEGDAICELTITNGDIVISTLNFRMQVEEDPLKDGIESETEIHNLTTQIQDINAEIVPDMVAEEVARQYTGDVIFDDEPTENHGDGYAVNSAGLKAYIPKIIDNLDDVSIDNPATNQALVWDAENNVWTNGEVSTVGNLDDLSDVDTTGKASGDSLRYDGSEWIAKPTTIALTQAEYNSLQTKEPNTHYIITDAPNLNPTASDIEYQSGVTVKQAIDSKAEVESGSNSNGYYIKFSDGTMICTKTASVEVLNTAWGDWGTLKEVTSLSLGDFAETFYQAPNVSLSLSGDAAWLERISGTTVSSVGTISILRPNSPGRTTNYSVSVTAIGRWKA